MIWAPRITVAAVAEQRGRFLMVEEEAEGRVVVNQPAGHLDQGEGLLGAVVRETLEETAWHFEPRAVIGIYLWTRPQTGCSYLRIAFAGACTAYEPERPLDHGILRALWLSRDELLQRRARLRSPMVLRTVDDYLAGRRFPLDLLHHLDEPSGAL
jgi:8-oxo-dGTP pyrophosphatase MutT (NUDIX family)